MKKENFNKFENNENFKKNFNGMKKSDVAYSYYSRVLKEPFDSIEELKEAEEAYYAKLKAKEDKAAAKKADAKKVEDAFKALNTTRRAYKESLTNLTVRYSEDLKKLKEAFEGDKKELQEILAGAEEAYSTALKEFTEKYPEGYHLTLKDGDFETTISSHTSNTNKACKPVDFSALADIFDFMFNY